MKQDPVPCGKGQLRVCSTTPRWGQKPSTPRPLKADEAKSDSLSLLFLPFLVLLFWATGRNSSCPKGKEVYLSLGFSALAPLVFLS